MALQSSILATDQFFKHEARDKTSLSPYTMTRILSNLRENITTACKGRKETIPVMARAKNLKGKWKYLVQKSGNRVQHHEVSASLFLRQCIESTIMNHIHIYIYWLRNKSLLFLYGYDV